MDTNSIHFWIKAFFFTILALIYNATMIAKGLRTENMQLESIASISAILNVIALILIAIVILKFRRKDKRPLFT